VCNPILEVASAPLAHRANTAPIARMSVTVRPYICGGGGAMQGWLEANVEIQQVSRFAPSSAAVARFRNRFRKKAFCFWDNSHVSCVIIQILERKRLESFRAGCDSPPAVMMACLIEQSSQPAKRAKSKIVRPIR
jgi:hypothetical protein